MQQPCPRCGYISDRPARFCRQCGTPLFAETETTGAATRNYEPRQTDQPSSTSQPLSGRGPGLHVQETTRFYQPPAAPNFSAYPVEQPRKSRAGLWILIAFLSLVLVGGGMIGLVSYAIRSSHQANNQPPLPPDFGEQVQKQVEKEIEEALKGISQSQQESERARQEAERAQKEAGSPDSAPPPPSLPPPAATGLDNYKYPNATVDRPVKFLGNEALSMITDDSFNKVKGFYQKLMGDPMVQSEDQSEESEKKVIFHSSGPP